MDEQNAAVEKPLTLDFSLSQPEDRIELVNEIIARTPPDKLSSNYLGSLANYITEPTTKEEKKQKKIITENRMVTINKRETSYEGLVGRFENGEDGVYNLIRNDKNIIFSPHVEITEEDLRTIPGLRELHDSIKIIEEQIEDAKAAHQGRRVYQLMKTLIEMRKDQYIIRGEFKKPIFFMNVRRGVNRLDFDEKITINPEDQTLTVDSTLSLLNPKHVSVLLCNYTKIKEEVWDKFQSDTYYLIMDLENLVDKVLKEDYPMYFDLLVDKIDGRTNEEIQAHLLQVYGTTHSVEYISSLWRNKIPKLIAEQAQKDYLMWYYTAKEKGTWKKCSRCGEIKLAHNMFFSKNNTSRDGFYSLCKDCRNAKTKSKKQRRKS